MWDEEHLDEYERIYLEKMQEREQTNMPTGDTHVQGTTSERREPEENEPRSSVAHIETEQEHMRNKDIA